MCFVLIPQKSLIEGETRINFHARGQWPSLWGRFRGGQKRKVDMERERRTDRRPFFTSCSWNQQPRGRANSSVSKNDRRKMSCYNLRTELKNRKGKGCSMWFFFLLCFDPLIQKSLQACWKLPLSKLRRNFFARCCMSFHFPLSHVSLGAEKVPDFEPLCTAAPNFPC